MKKRLFLFLTITLIMLFGSSITAYASSSDDSGNIFAVPSTTSSPSANPGNSSAPSEDPVSSSSPSEDSGDNSGESPAIPQEKPTSTDNASVPVPSFTTDGHVHVFEWKITVKPTEEKDGLACYICNCGHIDATQPISSAHAFIQNVVTNILDAPENGTVVITPKLYRCYTFRVLDALMKRPDVTLKTVYSDGDDIEKSFSITAKDINHETVQFYGFTYLGNSYGWNE